MLRELKNLTKQSAIYGLGSVLNTVLGFVLIPVYTRYLSPADYGVYSLLFISGAIARIVALLGLSTAMFREVIYHESDEQEVISTTFNFLVIESILFFAALIMLAPHISDLLLSSPEYTTLLQLTLLTKLLGMLDFVVMAVLRIRGQAALYSLLVVSTFLIGIGLNILFIVILQRGLEGLVLAGLLLAVVTLIIDLFILRKDLRLVFSLPILRRMLNYGIPLVPIGLASFLMTSADQYFLEHYSTTAEVGIYSLGYKFGMAVQLAVTAIQLAWPAQMFAIAKEEGAEKKFARILTYYVAALGFAGLGISALSREALVIMTTPDYYSAYLVVPLVTLSYIFYGCVSMTNVALETQGRTRISSVIMMGTTGLNLGLNYLLIPSYGMMGAAWATVISYLALLAVQVAVNQHYWYIPYEFRRILKIAVAWALVYGLGLLVQTGNPWLDAVLKGFLLLAFPGVLYALNFYSRDELETLRALLRAAAGRARALGRRLAGQAQALRPLVEREPLRTIIVHAHRLRSRVIGRLRSVLLHIHVLRPLPVDELPPDGPPGGNG